MPGTVLGTGNIAVNKGNAALIRNSVSKNVGIKTQ